MARNNRNQSDDFPLTLSPPNHRDMFCFLCKKRVSPDNMVMCENCPRTVHRIGCHEQFNIIQNDPTVFKNCFDLVHSLINIPIVITTVFKSGFRFMSYCHVCLSNQNNFFKSIDRGINSKVGSSVKELVRLSLQTLKQNYDSDVAVRSGIFPSDSTVDKRLGADLAFKNITIDSMIHYNDNNRIRTPDDYRNLVQLWLHKHYAHLELMKTGEMPAPSKCKDYQTRLEMLKRLVEQDLFWMSVCQFCFQNYHSDSVAQTDTIPCVHALHNVVWAMPPDDKVRLATHRNRYYPAKIYRFEKQTVVCFFEDYKAPPDEYVFTEAMIYYKVVRGHSELYHFSQQVPKSPKFAKLVVTEAQWKRIQLAHQYINNLPLTPLPKVPVNYTEFDTNAGLNAFNLTTDTRGPSTNKTNFNSLLKYAKEIRIERDRDVKLKKMNLYCLQYYHILSGWAKSFPNNNPLLGKLDHESYNRR